MRPLYIATRSGARISAQGPTLRVDRPDRAPAVMALRYVSQVVCPVTTHWSSKALSQCMQSGVPIVFTDPGGKVIGFLYGQATPKCGDVFARLIELLDQSDGMRIYTTWRKAMESRQRCRLSRHLRIPADRHRCRTLKRICTHERQRRAETHLVQLLERCWHQALAGFSSEYLSGVGMSARHQRTLWPQVDLSTQFASYLEWDLLLPSLEILNHLTRASRAGRPTEWLRTFALARFGCLCPDLEARASEWIHRLDIRLLEEGIV
ncbi:MAG: CRISPR-associated endonuclease Cas1 [Xanthomonadales bacterium]|nr:CRISPR-associated endonuclease Cas1 [Xanthomonadales bacterium]